MKTEFTIEIETEKPILYLREFLDGKELKAAREQFQEDFHRQLAEGIRYMIQEDDTLEQIVLDTLDDDWGLKGHESFSDLFKQVAIRIR